MALNKKIVVQMTIRLLIGILFFYSGYSKLVRPVEYFELAIEQFRIVPGSYVSTVAFMVPWIEILTGLFLVLGYAVRLSASILIGLTTIFQIVLAQALIRKLSVDECGCFGGSSIHLSLYQSLFLDTLLVVVLIFIVTAPTHSLSVDGWFKKRAPQIP